MQLDRDALARIAAAAATLDERLAGGFDPVALGAAIEGEKCFTRWRDTVARGNAIRFRRRLRAEGWTLAGVRAALGPVQVRAGDALPQWAVAVGDAVARASASPEESAELRASEEVEASEKSKASEGSEEFEESKTFEGFEEFEGPRGASPECAAGPFDDVLRPFVAVARARVGAAPHARLLRAAARAEIDRALLRRLGADFEPALQVELGAFAAVRGVPAAQARPAFVAHLREGGLARLLARLPVLARLAGTRVVNGADATTELLRRLAADHALIRRTFAAGRPIGRVAGVEPDRSDPHRGGRTVCVLRFDSGLRVVYKPRPLAVDAAWQGLLRWLAARGAGPALRPLAVLDRGAYGWMEHAAAAPCRGAVDAARFNERGGALLCLAYALGGGDFHADNVIGSGAHPLLVDVEVLFGAGGGRRGGAAGAQHASVLHTGLLPRWVPGPAGRVRRQGGLIEPGPIVGGTAPPPSCQPEAATRRPPEDARRVARGFTRMYRALLRHRADLLAADGPLAAFAGAEVRVVPRATWVYAVLLHRLRHPACLSGGAAHFIEADTLCRAWLSAPSTSAASWRSLASERAALAAGDIPIFTARIPGLPSGSSAEGAGSADTAFGDVPAHRVDALSEEDLRVQRRLILLAYTGRAARRRSMACAAVAVRAPNVRGAGDRSIAAISIIPRRPKPVWARAMDADRDPSPVCFADEALAIAEGLLRSAIHLPGGGVTWLAPTTRGPAGFAPAGPALAHGSTGIALFLAACAASGCGARYRAAALRALRPLLRDLGETGAAARLAAGIGVGGAAGVGGIVYALATIATLLGDEGPIAAASMMARAIGRDGVKQGRALDVHSGAAGAVLGLLALHRATGCGDALARAADWGRLASAAGAVRGRGFAHGAPGIAHALLQLHRSTGDVEFRAAAGRAFAVPEPRARRGVSATAWCSGAAGVGLARAAALDGSSAAALDAGPHSLARLARLPVVVAVASAAFPSPVGAVDEVLEDAIDTVRREALDALDHPCCGNAGAVELLLVAAERAGRPELRHAAIERASSVVRRARLRRTYATGIEDRYTPGFLQGAAGIGYTLLRVEHPHLPCALLWE